MKTCDYNHLILYAKGHYERNNVLGDVKVILAERCGLQSASHVSDEDMWMMVHHALLEYAGQYIHHYLRELFKPLHGEEDFGPLVWFTRNCPLERAVRLALIHLMRIKVLDDEGNQILKLGSPDPAILPLSENIRKRHREAGQKHDPFSEPNRTHCGDCNRLLTDGAHRIEPVVFDDGVRCEKCYAEKKLKQPVSA